MPAAKQGIVVAGRAGTLGKLSRRPRAYLPAALEQRIEAERKRADRMESRGQQRAAGFSKHRGGDATGTGNRQAVNRAERETERARAQVQEGLS